MLLALLIFPLTTTLSYGAKSEKPQWNKSDYGNFNYNAVSLDNYQVEAQLSLVDKTKSLDFRLVWENQKFCTKYEENNSVLGIRKYYVNGQAIEFNITCFKNRYVNVTPTDKDTANKYIFKEFYKNRGNVSFERQRIKSEKSVIYLIPSRGFRKFYNLAKKATKPTL